MTINWKACRPSPVAGRIFTPKVRLVYPHLFTPTTPKGSPDGTKAKYQVSLLVPAGCDLALLKELAAAAKRDKFGDREVPKLKTPFLKTAEQERLLTYKDDYPILIRASSESKPDVIDAKAQRVEDEDQVYGGRWATVSVNAYAWEHPTGGKGVSFGLGNVMLLDHDEPIAANRVAASQEFQPVDDGAGGTATGKGSLFGDDDIAF